MGSRFALEVFKHVYLHDNDVVMCVVDAREIPSGDYPRNRVRLLGFVNRKELRNYILELSYY